jgi:thioredoxin 1
MRRTFFTMLILLAALGVAACRKDSTSKTGGASVDVSKAKVTFLELGSTTCIPCKRMQPVMKSVEARYAGQVKVVFHDVMKDRTISQQYGIKLIPTQVFLDSSGNELMRHEGFLAEQEIDKFLRTQGLTPQS